MTDTQLNRISARITQPKSQGASQAMLYATGMTEADMQHAQVGIASVRIKAEPISPQPITVISLIADAF